MRLRKAVLLSFEALLQTVLSYKSSDSSMSTSAVIMLDYGSSKKEKKRKEGSLIGMLFIQSRKSFRLMTISLVSIDHTVLKIRI